MSDISVYPIFSSPLGVTTLETKNFLKALRAEEFISASGEYIEEQSTSERTKTLYLLNSDIFLGLKNQIIEKFNDYKNNCLMFDTTEFQMTTSWGVKVGKNAYSQFHSHSNSYISGVLYLNGDEESGDIEFESPVYEQIMPVPNQFNFINSKTWNVKPQKDLLLFFPSYLKHRIKKHLSNDDRYSIAFNFIPYNTYGKGDSQISLVFPNN
jgi:uncharacterized protein (TIGR02466 family)